jgi:hypothetical protein
MRHSHAVRPNTSAVAPSLGLEQHSGGAEALKPSWQEQAPLWRIWPGRANLWTANGGRGLQQSVVPKESDGKLSNGPKISERDLRAQLSQATKYFTLIEPEVAIVPIVHRCDVGNCSREHVSHPRRAQHCHSLAQRERSLRPLSCRAIDSHDQLSLAFGSDSVWITMGGGKPQTCRDPPPLAAFNRLAVPELPNGSRITDAWPTGWPLIAGAAAAFTSCWRYWQG